MFDLTPQLQLETSARKIYTWLRFAVFASLTIFLTYCAYRTIFPIRQFTLDANDKSPGNSGIAANSTGRSYLVEVFSHKSIVSRVNLQLRMADDQSLENQPISLHKTYKAFAYPVSPDPAKFPDGQLVQHEDDFYLVSDGTLRKFASKEAARLMGYPVNAFTWAEQAEIDLHPLGSEIGSENYPDGTFFVIDSRYYQLKKGTLHPFVNLRTYRAYSPIEQHVKATAELLNRYPVASDPMSFPDGSLLGYAGGVFLVDNATAYSFPDELAFEAMGYSWDDVIEKVTGDEFGAFRRGSALPATSPHPDNTAFFDEDSQQYFLVKAGVKQVIRGKNIQAALIRHSPITAQQKSLEEKISCLPQASLLFSSRFNCYFDVTSLGHFAGNDYRFTFDAPEKSVGSIRATLKRQLNRSSFDLFVSEVRYKFKFRYEFLFR